MQGSRHALVLVPRDLRDTPQGTEDGESNQGARVITQRGNFISGL